VKKKVIPADEANVTLNQDEDGMWVAECRSIPGCVSQAKTETEALKNIKDTISLCRKVQGDRRPMTPQRLLLNPLDLRKASPAQLEALGKYMKQRSWKRLYHRDRRMYWLLCEGVRRFKACDIPGITLREMMRIARALGYRLTVEFVDKGSHKSSRPKMSRELAEKRAGDLR
jgi:predicted RNase H-like HicB family nuclease